MPGNSRCLMIFSKRPQPGRVKTRLVPALGASGAAQLYSDLLERTFEFANVVKRTDVQVWVDGDPERQFADCIETRFRFECYPQSGADLGQRMYRAMRSNQGRYANMVLIGCDCPGLSTMILESAFAALESGYEAVLGPAFDGGYYLIGLRNVYQYVFEDIKWGDATVAESTREKFRALYKSWEELPVLRDIDTPRDLEFLEQVV